MTDIQRAVFDIFLEVKRICEKHNLRYLLFAGTMLGAIRHKGFIPWDDDLDIALPDEDYFKFLKIAPRELPASLSLVEPGELPHSYLLFSKVQNLNTTFLETLEVCCPDSYKGVFIDIFPLGGLPANEKERNKYCKKMTFYFAMNTFRRRKLSQVGSMAGKISWILTSPVHLFTKRDFWLKKWQRGLSQYKFDDSEYATYLTGTGICKSIYRTEWLDEIVYVPFESTEAPCPKMWDTWLTIDYGDYMTLPPEDKRVAVHGGGIVDLNTPYSYYAQNPEAVKQKMKTKR